MVGRPDGFLRGALVLAGTTLLVRVLSVVYNPLVTRLFAPWDGFAGDAAMGIARVPMWTYQILLAFTASGFNVAISKLIAQRLAMGDSRGAQTLFRGMLYFMGMSGLLLAIVLWFGAPSLAQVLSGDPATIPGFRAVALSIPAMTLMAGFRGLFQGAQRMGVAGMSQVIEQVARVASGIGLVAWLAPKSVVMGAAGYNLSDVPGALVALGYLWWQYRSGHHELVTTPGGGDPPKTGVPRPWLRELLSFGFPVALIAAALPLMMQLDAWLVFDRLRSLGTDPAQARAAYGQLSNAFTLIFLPTVLSGALYLSLVPAIADSLTRGDVPTAMRRTRTAYRVVALLGLPIAAGLWTLASPIYRLVFGGNGGHLLEAMALGALFLMIQQTASGILQGTGDSKTPAFNLLLGVLIKVILSWYLTLVPGVGVRGAAIGTVVGFGVVAGLNLWAVSKRLQLPFDWDQLVVRPGVAALIMAGTLYGWQILWPITGHLETIALVAVGAVVYVASLAVVRGIEAADVRLVPRVGPPVAAWLKRYKLL